MKHPALLFAFLVAAALRVPAQENRVVVPEEAVRSVDRAVQWLCLAQNHNGSWGDNRRTLGDAGNTAVACLALMSAGTTLDEGRHWQRLRRGVDWLRRKTRGYEKSHQQIDDQTLIKRKLGPRADLYLTALLWSQLLGMNLTPREDQRMREELVAMAMDIASLQQPNGAFETSYEPMLTTISAWLALRQAHDCGIAVPSASPMKVVRYLEEDCLDKSSGVFREAKWGRRMRFVTQAGALRVFFGMGDTDRPAIRKATRVLVRMRFDQDVGGRHGGEEFLAALFATQALHFQRDSEDFRIWYSKIVAALLACQNRDGSWQGHHCITGRVFCTGCSVMTMLTPQQMLPMIDK